MRLRSQLAAFQQAEKQLGGSSSSEMMPQSLQQQQYGVTALGLRKRLRTFRSLMVVGRATRCGRSKLIISFELMGQYSGHPKTKRHICSLGWRQKRS